MFLRARFASDRGLWLDEYGTVWAARGADWHETVRRVEAIHGQSPLYYLLERGVFAALGESDARARLLGVVLGALVPLLGYLAAARAWGRRAGAVALVLLAFDPHLIHYSETARPYPLAHAGTLLAVLGLVRAVETGSVAWRAVAWGGAVLAVYAHYIFAPLLPALLLGALLSERRAYARRALLADLALATVALVPALRHMAAISARRSELAWVSTRNLAVLGSVLPARVRWFALAGAAWGLASARVAGRRLAGRALLAFALGSGALAAGALLALLVAGSNILDERYLALALVAMPLASAWALASLPRPIAAVALAVVAVLNVRAYDQRWHRDAWRQEWREAAAELRAHEPRPGEPVLIWSGFLEARLVLDPRRTTPELRGFLASPLDDQPGYPESGLTYHALSHGVDWSIPGMRDYFEGVLAPDLARSARFFLVAPPSYAPVFEPWLASRFPGRFECVQRSRVFFAPAVVSVYRAR